MAGTDEANAREALATMQERLARGPHAALGILPRASAEEVRGAFLALTKLYHPARFGRMSPDIHRLANEVFLGIKASHDLLRQHVGQKRTTTSPGMPIVKMPTGLDPSSPNGVPIRPTNIGMAPVQRPPRQVTDRLGVPRVDQTRPLPVPTVRAEKSGGMRAITDQPASGGVVRAIPEQPSAPTDAPRPGNTSPLHIRREPTARTPVLAARLPGTAPTAQFARLNTQSGPIARLDPSTTMPPAPSVAVAVDLLAKGQWDAAKVALSALAAMAPESTHVRALVCFAVGRQAQLEHRLDEARVELQRALQLDPDLAPAKAAMAELFSRRK